MSDGDDGLFVVLEGIDGAGTTIAVLEGWDDPEVGQALAELDKAFGLPAPPKVTTIFPAGPLPAEATRYHRAYTLSLIGEVMLDLQDWTGAAAMFHDARQLISAAELPGLAEAGGVKEIDWAAPGRVA